MVLQCASWRREVTGSMPGMELLPLWTSPYNPHPVWPPLCSQLTQEETETWEVKSLLLEVAQALGPISTGRGVGVGGGGWVGVVP